MSFSFFFRKKPQNLFHNIVDFHNHILPGIDDGSKSISQSLKMLDIYQDLGVEAVIASPHIYKDLYPNTPESISKSFETLSPKAIQKNVEMKGYAAEYLVDEFFLEHLKNNTPLKDSEPPGGLAGTPLEDSSPLGGLAATPLADSAPASVR